MSFVNWVWCFGWCAIKAEAFGGFRKLLAELGAFDVALAQWNNKTGSQNSNFGLHFGLKLKRSRAQIQSGKLGLVFVC